MARKKRFSLHRGGPAPLVMVVSVLVPVLLVLVVAPVVAQQPGDPGIGDRDITQPWITISPPTVAEEDPRSETLALVIADNLELTLYLIGEYVVRPRPTERTAPVDAASAAAYAEREEVDYVVFGDVSERPDGSTEFALSVYSRETGTVTLERRAVAETIFDTFDVADELAVEVLGAFTGQRIAYGRVELANLGEAGAEYQVLVDGTVVGRNLTAVDRVLVGERLVEVEVLTGPQAGEVVASRRLLVEEGAQERVEFVALAPLAVPEPGDLLVEVPEEPEIPEEPEDEPEPEIAVAPEAEPEIPLELRAYEWRRNDPGRDWVGSLSFHSTWEARPEWNESHLLVGLRGRYDWGTYSSAFLGYESSINSLTDFGHDRYLFDEGDIGADITFEPEIFQRIYIGYGLRVSQIGSLTLIPSLRLGVERQYFRAVADGQVGTSDDVALLFDPDYEYSRSYWSISSGIDLSAELMFRRFLVYGNLGSFLLFPRESEYDDLLRGKDSSTGEDLLFPATGSIERSYGWYAGLGIGYAWGGDEEEVNRQTTDLRTFRAFSGPGQRNWGLHLSTSLGFLNAAQRAYIPVAPVALSPAVSLEWAHSSGVFLAVGSAMGNVSFRHGEVLYLTDEESELTDVSIDAGMTPGITLILGRRLQLSERWFVSPSYRLGRAATDALLESEQRGWDSTNSPVTIHGPRLAVEYSLPGTSATVFSAAHWTMISPRGETDYSVGFEDAESLLAPDGYGELSAFWGVEAGVLFRLAGMPPRLLAQDVDRSEWFRYSGVEGAGDANDRGFFRRVLTPRYFLGTEVEFTASGAGTESFFIVPAAVRFPFGLELTLAGALPIQSGFLTDREEHELLDPDARPDVRSVEGRLQIARALWVEAGYRFRRNRRLSFRPAMRFAWIEWELWNIKVNFEDGSTIDGGKDSFARMENPEFYLGPVADLMWSATDRVSLRLGVGALLDYRAWPDLSHVYSPIRSRWFPDVEAHGSIVLTTLNVGFSVEL